MYAYVATDLRKAELDADFDENISVERVPLADTIGLIEKGEIQDGKSIAALLMAVRQHDNAR